MANTLPYYFGNDLGAVYGKAATVFRLWAPTADAVTLCLYQAGDGDCLLEQSPMKRDVKGTWLAEKEGDLDGVYYTYRVRRGERTTETQDPYAVAAGVNGRRSMVLDLEETDPQGFAEDCGPKPGSKTDLVVCEISVADTTADESCGSSYPGKYLGLAERGLRRRRGCRLDLTISLRLA